LRYRQLRGVAWPPSAPPPQGTGTAPDGRLVLDHVHGYRGSDVRDNIWFTRRGEIVYFVAAVAVVEDTTSGTLPLDCILTLHIVYNCCAIGHCLPVYGR
jgi:hypothetical protein